MTKDEINRRIAEACLYYVMQDDSGGGWKLVDPNQDVRWAWTSSEHAWSPASQRQMILDSDLFTDYKRGPLAEVAAPEGEVQP